MCKTKTFAILSVVLTIFATAGAASAQWTTNGNNINSTNSGNVGIGTTSPGGKLDLNGADAAPTSGATTNGTLLLGATPTTNLVLAGGVSTTSGIYSWFQSRNRQSAAFYDIALNPLGGNVGIGTIPNASYKLDVNGSTNITGNINVTGNIAAKYQDIAEWVPTSQRLTPGTVVVLDAERGSDVVASSQAYDTKVAGVISIKPGLALGESGEDKVLVATTGRVRVKVDATHAPIRVGDLLVTSTTTGYAMKSEPIVINGRSFHSPGTLIGKALEPLEKGTGEIMVLLSLQ
ncbi:MAG TPA: hypothetical protein VJ749_01670 [Pyrinomonadaceae bacterium]|nr:hypothetical protein [Pyrinomonadaceae bacterium]